MAQGEQLRRELVDTLLREGHVRSVRVVEAMLAVPREVFVPEVTLEEAYRSSDAIVVKRIDGVGVSSASAPDVVAFMLEQLEVEPGQRVLEIGAGTGYNAALLSRLVGPSGRVLSVDIDEDLVAGAREHVRQVGCTNVEVVQGDGALGYAADEPFDRIILTVATRDIAPAWRDQLRPETGRLVMPLALRGPQRCVAFVPMGDHLRSASVRGCGFMPLRGLMALNAQAGATRRDNALAITTGQDDVEIDASGGSIALEAVAASLAAPAATWPSGVQMANVEKLRGLELWLATHDDASCTVWGAPDSGSPVPDLVGQPDRVRATFGLCDPTGVAVLAWCDDARASAHLCVRAAAPAEHLAARLLQHVQSWNAAGQPADGTLQIRAYPHPTPAPVPPGAVALPQRWTTFVLRWT
jgi:protein-L-isoaspartate(D-aspartate) O-methyltransferase